MEINDEQKINDIAEKIAKQFQPEKIILFGSRVWGKPGPDSDVDLFIIKNTDNTRQEARRIDGSIFPRSFPLDVIVSTPGRIKERIAMGDTFIKKIVETGKILYG